METTTTPTTTPQDPVKGQFAAALRQYQYYSHGRSIRKFCEDEGLDYQKFCKYAREHGPGSDAVGISVATAAFQADSAAAA